MHRRNGYSARPTLTHRFGDMSPESMSPESPAHPRFPHLLSPIRIGPRRLRCRVLVTAHEIRLGDGRIPGARYAAYHRARARGGAGLQITGCTAVHHTGGLGSGGALANVDDSIIDGYRVLSGAVHEEGGVILAQLGHSAATTHATEPGAPVWAPSAVTGELMRRGQRAHAMSVGEIAEIVAAFGAAAERCREGGMDGVEILAAFGFLVAAFLSPVANRRTDAYGGSLDNRMRFCREVVSAVRDAVGRDRIVGLRVPGDELIEGGLQLEEMKDVARALESDGKLDYLNVIAGTNMDRLLRAEHWPPTPARHGLFVHLAAGIRSVVELPVFTVGRITDPVQAERILAGGEADMVGMTRAHVADPDLIAKLREDRLDDIRPCVGANVCIRNGLEGRSIGCIHNPRTGRELAWGDPAPAGRSLDVAVVGGGPAGLEAARVAALRGHRVTLHERSEHLGGQLRTWARLASRRELNRIVEWQQRQLERLQVRIRLGHPVESAADLDGAEVVVLAAGARPGPVSVAGAAEHGVSVRTAHEVLDSDPVPAAPSLVWDRAGGGAAVAAAEHLAEAGCRVVMVTPSMAVADDVDLTNRVPLYRRLYEHGVTMLPDSEVARVDAQGVVVTNVYTGGETTIPGIERVVVADAAEACDELADALREEDLRVLTAGDCVSPREVDVAMAEGALAAREI